MPTTKTIFIIDDDSDDQFSLVEAIKEIDVSMECYTAMNGQEGWQRLETRSIPQPSLIFLDLNMPRIDGRRFLTAIKNHPQYKSIPVIIYTTSSNLKDREEMMQLGAADYLIKQPDFSTLKEDLYTIFSLVE